jgi:uncharacterized membrane protein (DUF2068 family)
MDRHVRLLGVLYLGWAAFSLLVGVSTLLLAFGAAAVALTSSAELGEVAAGLTAATFAVIGLMALGWAAVHAVEGFGLRRREPWSRTLGLALGAVNLLLLPFGTALGLYALWVLLSADTRRLIDGQPA